MPFRSLAFLFSRDIQGLYKDNGAPRWPWDSEITNIIHSPALADRRSKPQVPLFCHHSCKFLLLKLQVGHDGKIHSRRILPLVEFLSISLGKETQVPNQSWNPSNFREQGSWVVVKRWTFLLHNFLPRPQQSSLWGWGQPSKLSWLFDSTADKASSDRYGLGCMFCRNTYFYHCMIRVFVSWVTRERAEMVDIYIGLMLCQKLY